MTGREVARLVGRNSHSGVLDVLNRLAEHGLVERQEAGRAFLYKLNRDHLAAPAVEVLANMRSELLSRLRRATGNRAGIAEVGEDEIPRLLRDEPPIVSELSSDAIVLTGPEIGAPVGTPR